MNSGSLGTLSEVLAHWTLSEVLAHWTLSEVLAHLTLSEVLAHWILFEVLAYWTLSEVLAHFTKPAWPVFFPYHIGNLSKVSTANKSDILPVLVGQTRLGNLDEVNFLPSEEFHSIQDSSDLSSALSLSLWSQTFDRAFYSELTP